MCGPRRLTGELDPSTRVTLVEVPYAEVARMDLTVHTRRFPFSRICRCGEQYPCPDRLRALGQVGPPARRGLTALAVAGVLLGLALIALTVTTAVMSQ